MHKERVCIVPGNILINPSTITMPKSAQHMKDVEWQVAQLYRHHLCIIHSLYVFHPSDIVFLLLSITVSFFPCLDINKHV